MKCGLVSLWVLLLHHQTLNAQQAGALTAADFSEVMLYNREAGDALAWTGNAVGLAGEMNAMAGVYSCRPYLLEGLGEHAITGSLPVFSGGLGMYLAYSGSSYLNTSKAGIAYGRSLTDRLALGLGFDYQQLSLRGYGRSGFITARAGGRISLTGRLHLLAHVVVPATDTQNGAMQLSGSTGIGFIFSPQLSGFLSIHRMGGSATSVHAGFLYRPVHAVSIKAGFSGVQPASWLSLGWQRGRFQFEVQGSYHLALGLTPGIALQFLPPLIPAK